MINAIIDVLKCIILATKPLLFGYFQRSLDSPVPIGISSTHGLRALARVCIGSAQQILKIVQDLMDQSLLGSCTYSRDLS